MLSKLFPACLIGCIGIWKSVYYVLPEVRKKQRKTDFCSEDALADMSDMASRNLRTQEV